MQNKKEINISKQPLSLIPSEIMPELAKVFAIGAEKYGKNNFRESGKVSTYLDAALRHIHEGLMGPGSDIDSGSNCHHFTCAIANLIIARLYIRVTDENLENCPFEDDRYVVGSPDK